MITMTANDTLTKVKLRNIKRAKLKQLQTLLELQIKNKTDKETINQTKKEIQKTQTEIKKLM